MKYFSAWEIYTQGLRQLVEKAFQDNEVQSRDIVWRGPSGDAVIADDVVDTDYIDYTDEGMVEEYL